MPCRKAGIQTADNLHPILREKKRFRGKLASYNADSVTITTADTGDEVIAMSNLNRAKLILTDELAKLALKKRSVEK